MHELTNPKNAPQGLCNPAALLAGGVPPGLQLALWRATQGSLETQGGAWGLVAAAAALPFAVYAARSWLTAQAVLARGVAGALPRLRALQGQSELAQAVQYVAGSRGLAWGLGKSCVSLCFVLKP
jgi:hypothetical protein